MSDKNKKKKKQGKTSKVKPVINYTNPDTGEDLTHELLEEIELTGDHTTKSRLKAKWREFMSPGGIGYDVKSNSEEMVPNILNGVQDGLDGAGLTPGVGLPFDVASGVVSAVRGDKTGAILSGMAAIPGGQALGALKILRRGKKGGKKWDEAVSKLREYYDKSGGEVPKWAQDIISSNPSKAKITKALPGPGTPSIKAVEVVEEVVEKAAEKKGRLARLAAWAKERGSNALPQNWSTTTKIGAGVTGAYGLYEALSSGSDKTEPNRNKTEVPTDSLRRFVPPVQEVVQEEEKKKPLEMGGSIQHQGGIEKPVGNGLTEYIGQTHEEGGIKIPGAEVEHRETEINDYVYSDSLQYGGRSFADASKEIVNDGGGEKELHTLARMQESLAANQGHEDRDPSNADEAFNSNKKRNGGYLQDLPSFNDGGNKNLGDKGVAANQTNVGGGYYASDDAKMVSEEEEKEDFYNRNKDVMNSMGINSYEEYNPETHAGMFQSKVNAHLKNKYDGDEELRNKLEQDGVSSAEDYILSQGFGGEGHQANDSKHGEYHNSISTQGEEEVAEPGEDVDETIIKEDIEEKEDVKEQRNGSALVDAAQFLPSMMAMGDKPNYMDTPKNVNAGIVVSSDVGHKNLDRVSLNADKARLQNNLQSMIGRNSNMSPAEKAALLLSSEQATSAITSKETSANAEISNTEKSLNASIDIGNADRYKDTSTTNATNILDASKVSAKNAMYADEFNKGADAATFDRKLDATQYATSALADIYKTKLKYNADQLESESISADTGITDRKLDFSSKYGGKLRKKKKRN